MSGEYNPLDWYWTVTDSSPSTHVWAGARGALVVLADATYVAWLAAGNTTTTIDTAANLRLVIDAVAASQSAGYSIDSRASVTADIGLVNPLSRTMEFEITASGVQVDFPQMNLPTSAPIGHMFVFKNSGVYSAELRDFTNLIFAVVYPQQTLLLIIGNAGLTSTAGTFIQGTPADNEYLPKELGGTGTDLSTTGGTSKFLKQASAGAQITVAQPTTSDISGLGTIATQAASAVSISGGAINGTAIGGSTPAAGAFTTLAASGDFAVATNKFTVAAASGNTIIAGTLNVTGVTTVGTMSQGSTTVRAAGGIQINNAAENSAVVINYGTATALTLNITRDFSLIGTAARNLFVERHSTADTAGNNFTVKAGGATSGATNKAGGNLILAPGVSTGSGVGDVVIQTSPGVAGATSDNTLTEVVRARGLGWLKFAASNFQANGSGTVTIGNVAPAGVATATITKWLRIDDGSDVDSYIPVWQ